MKKLTADNHEHTFSVAGIPDNTTYCTRCGLLKSTIEKKPSTEPTIRNQVNWLINGFISTGKNGDEEFIAERDLPDFREEMIGLVEALVEQGRKDAERLLLENENRTFKPHQPSLPKD